MWLLGELGTFLFCSPGFWDLGVFGARFSPALVVFRCWALICLRRFHLGRTTRPGAQFCCGATTCTGWFKPCLRANYPHRTKGGRLKGLWQNLT